MQHLTQTATPYIPRHTLARRRGRPKLARPMHDSGTAELVMKRLKGETAESIDLCLERDIITRNQHWCGIHLRWLYTLRFGAPGVKAIDPQDMGGMELKSHDAEWLSSREQEYQQALGVLAGRALAAIVMNVCIFNERPLFLTSPASRKAAAQRASFLAGLELLQALWCRK